MDIITSLASPTDKLGHHGIETNILGAYENLAISSRRKLVILSTITLKMEVSVSEPCDVIRVKDLTDIYNDFKLKNPFGLLV